MDHQAGGVTPADVRLLYLRRDEESLSALAQIPLDNYLTAYELQRLTKFSRDDLREQWLLGRALREYAFRKYWQLHNPVLQLGENGKPALRDAVNRHFNLAHHPHITAVALADVPVGVDVEMQQRKIKRERLLTKHFSLQEATSINATREPDKQLLAHWCVKEAYLKARGKKIAGAQLENLTVELAPITAMVQSASLPFARDYCAQVWAVDDALLALVAHAAAMRVCVKRISFNEMIEYLLR